MATSSLLHLPELHFLSPLTPHRNRFSLSTHSISRLSTFNAALRTTRIRASKEDSVLAERVNDVEWSGNGAASSGYVNGAVNKSSVEYGYGNGVAAMEVVDVEASKVNEDGRKRRLEEIGKEDAWFKQIEKVKVEVAVAPGGRWSRFKTYSTIQRTLEIWGFVVTFIFKAWLDNQRFSYKGGMTEAKKKLRRKTLAKWLKESILRLGPTFIKIGQQFSTRVDILPQEYVDQLSELQDQVPPFPSETATAIVEEELGAAVGDIFDQFDYEPIAAASLGQVHRARLKEQRFWSKERAWIEARDAALMEALKNIGGREMKVELEGHNHKGVNVINEGEIHQNNIENQNEDGSEILNSTVRGTDNNYQRDSLSLQEGNKKRKENFYFNNNEQCSMYNQGSGYCDVNHQREEIVKLQRNVDHGSSPSDSNVGNVANGDACFPFLINEGGSLWENFGLKINKANQNN